MEPLFDWKLVFMAYLVIQDLGTLFNWTSLKSGYFVKALESHRFKCESPSFPVCNLFPERPHIVLMVADDLGWNDVSLHGSKQIPTPNIDVLALDGIILNQYYVQAICSPSRGSLMTGKYPIQFGFQHDVIGASEPWGLSLEEKLLPQYLKELNYSTHVVGKWHLGYFKEDYLPLKRGFDSFFGYYNGVKNYFTHVSATRHMEGLDLHDGYNNAWQFNGTYGTDLFTAKAKEVIREHNPEKPLFLYFAQQAPHSGNFLKFPLQAPDKYVKPMVGIEDEKRKTFAGMVSALDRSVGEVFNSLEESCLLDNTIFIFTSDNGGAPPETDHVMASNWPLKGSKYNLWEGGTRAVSFIWSPSLRHRSRIYNELMHISDWLPTILSAAGGREALKMLSSKEIVGVDQWPSLMHVEASPRQEILLNIDNEEGVEGIRKGRYKLVKGSYFNGDFDKWYDKEGKVLDDTCPVRTPLQKRLLYSENYVRFLKRSEAARVLWDKYDKDPLLAAFSHPPAYKKQLEVECGLPPPLTPTCDAKKKETCLFDIVRDPCEFHNIAEQLPEVTAELELAIEKYRPLVKLPADKPSDPKADPKLRRGAWEPWK